MTGSTSLFFSSSCHPLPLFSSTRPFGASAASFLLVLLRDKGFRNSAFFYTLVLIPHARNRHHPRAASKSVKTPATIKATQAHQTTQARTTPPTTNMPPSTARLIRPRRPMLLAKNFICVVKGELAPFNQEVKPTDRELPAAYNGACATRRNAQSLANSEHGTFCAPDDGFPSQLCRRSRVRDVRPKRRLA